MSWESTVTYYQLINQLIGEQLGGLHSAKIILSSVDFAEIEGYQSNNQWEKSGEVLGEEARKLEKAGADFFLICTNTMHKVADQVASKVTIPLVHIADATIDKLLENNIKKIGLLGTSYTMTQTFYKERIISAGIEVVIPNMEDIRQVNQIIFSELVLGKVTKSSKEIYLKVIEKMLSQGVEGIILGCTEIGLLISQQDTTVPLFDTTVIHSEKAVTLALENT